MRNSYENKSIQKGNSFERGLNHGVDTMLTIFVLMFFQNVVKRERRYNK